jgi:phosphatidylinositol 3-kinase
MKLKNHDQIFQQLENLVEMKHHRLARSQRAGQSEKDLKPNASTR